MKAQLTFNLPEEQEEFTNALDGTSLALAIHEIDQYMRSELKHAELTDEVHDKVQEIRDELHSILSNYNLAI